MSSRHADSGRPKAAKDPFSTAVYGTIAVLALLESIALVWLDLY